MTATARAVAHPNIALAKYWGKLDRPGNLPAVPSLSITLDGMTTTTTVTFDPALSEDRISYGRSPAPPELTTRAVALLDRVRAAAGVRTRASVETANDFPTASGLASSASGFAALALAATRAAGLDWELARVSDLARRSSASAARSLYGGFVALPAGSAETDLLAAEPVATPEHWDVVVVVAVTTEEAKKVGSTDGMQHTMRTSPLYGAWVQAAPLLYERVRGAVLARDFAALGAAAEQSALAMHGTAMGADPPLVYFRPATVAALARVRALRAAGTLAFATIDAGPHVKVLAEARDLGTVTAAMREVPGVERLIVARPGAGATATPVEPA